MSEKKSPMKNTLWFVLALLVINACKKDIVDAPVNPIVDNTPTNTSFSNLKEFYSKHGVQKEVFLIDPVRGGTFVSQKSTTIIIPPDAFSTISNGNIKIEFKDVYKKSDMLLSNMPTREISGRPLKSAGEFYIKASQKNQAVNIREGKKITIIQPFTGNVDTDMRPFIAVQDTMPWDSTSNFAPAWQFTGENAELIGKVGGYIFDLYKFGTPADSGTWCNSDSRTFFQNFQPANFTLNLKNSSIYYKPDAFLSFKSVNCMMHLYRTNYLEYRYPFAPTGLECTVIIIGVKNGKLYSHFKPLTITNNLKVTIDSLYETTPEAFKMALDALN